MRLFVLPFLFMGQPVSCSETGDLRELVGLLVEQNALMGLKNSDQGVVLDLGRTLFSGPADDVLRDPRIQDLYLGGKKAA